jgi:hypothetical protein
LWVDVGDLISEGGEKLIEKLPPPNRLNSFSDIRVPAGKRL